MLGSMPTGVESETPGIKESGTHATRGASEK